MNDSSNEIKKFVYDIVLEIIEEAAEPQLEDELRDELESEFILPKKKQEANLNYQNDNVFNEIEESNKEEIKLGIEKENNLMKESLELDKNAENKCDSEVFQYSSYSKYSKNRSIEINGKSNEEEFSIYSENEVKALVTPIKKLNSPADFNSNDSEGNHESDRKESNLNKEDQDSNQTQNECIYGEGNNISYGSSRNKQFYDNYQTNKQNPPQFQSSNTPNNSYPTILNPNWHVQEMGRRMMPRNFGMHGIQAKQISQLINNQQNEQILTHYEKIIEELKEEVKRHKEFKDSAIKQNNQLNNVVIEEYKNIIEKQKKIIEEK